jgi:23S rRNA A2030 N6-methylase RlmJ
MTNDKLIELWDSEIEFLKNLFGENKILVEIGCFKGKTTLALAEKNVVIAIDPFEENYDPQDLASREVKRAEKIFRKRIKGKNIIWYKQKSEEVLKNWRLMVAIRKRQ